MCADQESGDHEEDVDADVTATESGDLRVEQHDECHRDRAHALNVETFLLLVSATERRRFHLSSPRELGVGEIIIGSSIHCTLTDKSSIQWDSFAKPTQRTGL
ncbi:hypothetical protein MTY66_32460 [Mycolicibacterium sp. TY66]|nr:hypothetical protein MTY66_32460 [Mycolicibacterium sp. TY66]BCJ80728.1 hypothetical protein MTY81_21010 [Mycolicibacterium sp. TY81]